MKWFEEVFLPSVYDRTAGGRGWLTAKQVSICAQYMSRDVVSIETADGGRGRHVVLSADWRGRSVRVDVSKKNGAGAILFGLTEAEREQHKREAEAEREQHERECAARAARRRPEYAAKRLAALERMIAEAIEDAEEEKAAGTYSQKDDETDSAFIQSVQNEAKIWREAISAAAKSIG